MNVVAPGAASHAVHVASATHQPTHHGHVMRYAR